MGGFGWHNPWPFEWGGGRTLPERHYDFLRKAPGKGGVALDEEDSIDALWRQEKAIAMAALDSFSEHGLLQAFPDKATAGLEYFEELLGQTPEPGESDVARREEATVRFTFQIEADVPSLSEQLTRIDARLGILEVPEEYSETTEHGRAFEPYDASEPFGGGRKSTVAPNYSTRMIETVLLDLADSNGVPDGDDERVMSSVEDLLNEALPSWVDYRLLTSVGFLLDQSPLDATGFGS